jgi:hypothetical protein
VLPESALQRVEVEAAGPLHRQPRYRRRWETAAAQNSRMLGCADIKPPDWRDTVASKNVRRERHRRGFSGTAGEDHVLRPGTN